MGQVSYTIAVVTPEAEDYFHYLVHIARDGKPVGGKISDCLIPATDRIAAEIARDLHENAPGEGRMEYPCGCVAIAGKGTLPPYCPEHTKERQTAQWCLDVITKGCDGDLDFAAFKIRKEFNL